MNNSDNNKETIQESKLVNHGERYIKTLKTISKMSKEKIEEIIQKAKQAPMEYMPEEEASVVAEICRIYALKELENISTAELAEKGKALYKKHINSQQGKGDSLTMYEYSLLASINALSPIALNEIDFSEDGR